MSESKKLIVMYTTTNCFFFGFLNFYLIFPTLSVTQMLIHCVQCLFVKKRIGVVIKKKKEVSFCECEILSKYTTKPFTKQPYMFPFYHFPFCLTYLVIYSSYTGLPYKKWYT